MKSLARLFLASVFLTGVAGRLKGDEVAKTPPPEQIEFFEKQVRPLLIQHCIQCHGPEAQEAGLRLDSRSALIRGGDEGQVVVPGEPDKSRLIAAIRYDGDVQMPPDYKLSEKDFTALANWIRMGLPWPGDAPAASDSKPANKDAKKDSFADRVDQDRASHWAYQPVVRPPLPAVGKEAWCHSPVDRFVLAELEKQGLQPSPAADRRTLLRRVTFDLTGLPPTVAEIAAFEADSSPEAWAKVVDRLLASPAYGERWGRHWLDIARYSDTKGYVFTEERRYPYAYTYRDYVVQAFNQDLPYDQFILEQLAADQLPPRDHNRSLAAMGFLTVGRRFSNNQHDIIDDRIDVVTRGLLGLTVACARCHDHKYDAIPTADYYSLYGIFQSSTEPKELPLIGEPDEGPAYQKYQQELAGLQKELDEFLMRERGELQNEFRSQVGDYLAQVVLQKLPKESGKDIYISEARGDVRPKMVARWREFLAKNAKQPDPVFSLWHRFVKLPNEQFAAKAAEIVGSLADGATPPSEVNPLLAKAFVEQPPKELLDVARIYDRLLVDAHKQWLAAQTPPKPPAAEAASTAAGAAIAAHNIERLDDPAREQLRQALYSAESPVTLNPSDAETLWDRETRNKHAAIKRKIEALKVNSPAAPPRAMVMNDAPTPVQPRIFLRGNPARRGPETPRQFLQVLAGESRQPFQQGSGRLELAQAIVAPRNPLTSRVMVNRVWMYHFGSGLVATPSDFGIRSEPPTHGGLLDYLAATFVEEGWSLKKLHRQMLLSSTYRQASDERPEASQIDPENRLLWRMNRRRLEFEALRDALLAASGQLDRQLGGRPVELTKQPFTTRRTIYGLVDRQDLPDMFRVFDFASPDASTEMRPQTTVPQQGLFLLNAPFVLEQVRKLASRPDVVSPAEPSQRIAALYRAVLTREPAAEEVQAALQFIEAQGQAKPTGDKQLSPWEMFAQVLLLTNEFMFVD